MAKDPNEEKVYQKLAQLNEQLNKATDKLPDTLKTISNPEKPLFNSPDVDRLEKMIHTIKGNPDETEDPQMTKINGVLDKLMALQHPELLKDSIKELSQNHKSEVYPVKPTEKNDQVNFLQNVGADGGNKRRSNTFHILGNNHGVPSSIL